MTNMAIWDAVSKTNPDDTKAVSTGGRRFTAIDAYAQIRAATKQFGAVGSGWGWTILKAETLENAVILHIEFWYLDEGVRCSFETFGGSRYLKNNGEPFDPDEAYKKAMTDAITKALSYLGFNADVFTGKFDDNKYVQQMRKEFAETSSVDGRAPDMTLVDKLVTDAKAIIDSTETMQNGHEKVHALLKGVRNAEKEAFGEKLKQDKHEFITDKGNKTQRSYATTFRELWDYTGETE